MTGRETSFLGILMLDTQFERFAGDIGNARTWSMPVRFATVRGAFPERIVGISDDEFLQPFVDVGRQLVDQGAIGIATSCGFLSLYQRQLAAGLPVPVLTSSLLLVPLIEMMLPKDRTVGILTFSEEGLLPVHLSAAGINHAVPIQGLPVGGRFQRAVLENDATGDSLETRQEEVLWAGRQLVARHPDVGAILSECTNFGPHSAALAAQLSLPVYDIVSALNWFWSGLQASAPRHAGNPTG